MNYLTKFMNKLFLIGAILFSVPSLAQQSYGIKVGGQTTGITKAKMGDNQNQYGFYVGGFYTIPLKDNFSFQPELMYSYQSFNNVNVSYTEYFRIGQNDNPTGPRFDFKYKTHLIKLPLLLKYQPNKVYVEAGPELAYLLSVHGKYTDKLNEIPSENGKLENIKHFQAAIAVGGGYKINDRLEAGLRLSWGLTKFSEHSYIKNFNVGIGISYNLK